VLSLCNHITPLETERQDHVAATFDNVYHTDIVSTSCAWKRFNI